MPDMNCTAADMAKILRAIDVPVRHLRQTNDNKEELHRRTGRQLPSFTPPRCRETCRGFATGTCVAQACKGYHRGLEEDDETTEALEEGREMLFFDLNTIWCDWGIHMATYALDKLVSYRSVSASCLNLLKSDRTMDCLSVVC